jgi:two-component system cell cycle sensor histidine kinase/response regulator CckA
LGGGQPQISAESAGREILLMSSYIDESVVRQGIREKNVAYLQKPFSPMSLAKKVREVLDGLGVRWRVLAG